MRAIAALCSCFALTACVAQTRPERTALEIQAIQSREFEADKSMAFGAIVSVFQDAGYIVQSADKDTGFITAASPSGEKTRFWEALLGSSSSGQTRATAFVEQIRPNFVTVRLNFVNTMRTYGTNGIGTDHDQPVLNPDVYEVAFEKIDSAIFVRTGGRAPEPAQPTAR